LRKDFIIDAYQIYQSRVLEADCILLIVAALSAQQLHDFNALAKSLQLAVLVEVHDRDELQQALQLDCQLIGINNRDLRTFTTDLNTTIKLLSDIPADKIIITESGINTQDDVRLMQSHGVNAFLIGETFMRADNPGEKLKQLFSI